MTPLSIVLLSFLGGSLVTGGTILGITKAQKKEQDINQIITALETEFEKAQASAIVNLTEPDLLKIPCSADYMEQNGDMLCRSMFCRMNRQSEDKGSTESDCSSLTDTYLNTLKIETCFPYWNEGAGSDQNSKYSQCIIQFGKKN